MTNNERRPPVREVKVGPCRAAIWRNTGRDGSRSPYFTVTFSRLYKTEGGEWRNRTSFGVNDLPHVAMLVPEVRRAMVELAPERGREWPQRGGAPQGEPAAADAPPDEIPF